MQVLYRTEYLNRQQSRLMLLYTIYVNDVRHQISFNILHDYQILILGLDDLVQPDYIWVRYFLQDAQFPLAVLHLLLSAKLVLVNRFDSHLLRSYSVDSQLHPAESSLPYGPF